MTPAQRVYVLPARPRAADWPLAGVCAGLLLGSAELLLVHLDRVELAAGTAALVVAGAALIVTVLSVATGLVVAFAMRLPSRSALVGALLGPLLLAPGAGALLRALGDLGRARAVALLAMAAAVALAALGALGAAWIGERLERAGRPLPALPLWGAAALLAAAGERAGSGFPSSGLHGLVWLLGGLGCMAVLVAVRRGQGARRRAWSWPGSVAVAALLAGAVALAPAALPWLLLGRDIPALRWGPPSLLLIDLGVRVPPAALGARGSRGADGAQPNLALLASDGVRYENVRTSSLALPLALPDGSHLGEQVVARGYATRPLATDPRRSARERAARLSATAAAGVLAATAPDWLARSGLGGAAGSPEHVTDSALRWLLGWRTRRAPAPFLLAVDYTGAAGTAPAELLDHELGRLLEDLHKLELDEHTLVLVALRHPARSLDEPPGAWWLVRPPGGVVRVVAGARVARGVDPREMALALERAASKPPDQPLELPGLRPLARRTVAPTPGEAAP